MSSIRVLVATPLIALLAACGGGTEDAGGAEAAAPVGDAPPEIAQRQDEFEGIGDNFKLIREELETDAPDMAAIEGAATDINARFQRVIDLFPEGSSMEAGYDTEALAVIWEDPDDFARVHEAALLASEEMMAAAASGDPAAVGEQVGDLGLNGCKACHDKYRVDDD